MADTPVTFIAGPRQSGKTTLAKRFMGHGRDYFTLDDQTALLAATQDPIGFIRNLDKVIIDEIQRAPGLLPSIKQSVDEDRRPGRYLLTGSANLLNLPAVTESLAGRMETLILLPLSQSEIFEVNNNWLDRISMDEIAPRSYYPKQDLIQAVVKGGYPEAVARTSHRRRTTWFRQYITALMQRDLLEIAKIDQLGDMPRFLNALAQMSGQLCNYTQLGGQIGISHKTAAKYLTVFEQMFILKRIDAWSSNTLSRIIKTPKLHFLDSGLLASTIGLTEANISNNRSRYGKVLESFVYSELLKQSTWSEDDYRIYHYRDKDRYEVDFVIENSEGEIIGLEVKAGATIHQHDLRGLKRLRDHCPERFKLGLVLYDGDQVLSLGDRIYCAPISGLWGE
jgi:predicted AAA+ superfamily ATPase